MAENGLEFRCTKFHFILLLTEDTADHLLSAYYKSKVKLWKFSTFQINDLHEGTEVIESDWSV